MKKKGEEGSEDEIQEVGFHLTGPNFEYWIPLQVKEGDGKDDLLGLPVEPTGLEGAAFQSRVPNDKMTQVEFRYPNCFIIIF